ncbi:tetratricopeptide repeat protein [Polynucleobacter sp. JS-JIR-II-50]|uniref:tetratricopeptide repeat protein n=1 Tax=Polynucleobacter sp. JS-JIR-II-50 TaxID=2576919 RepID=UPI001BFCEB57|nr:tetratricopeptide repeat protein [Polynucleobacter sp. JS-JIR-II-50]QWE04601.1 tetratricopeptide repeat protein [Polynucleobacter sp. JS-JIR-II-50]
MNFKILNKLITLGEIDFRENRLEDACAKLKQAILLDPKNSKAHELLAYIYSRKGDQQRAFELLKIACAQSTASVGALYELGSLYLNDKQFTLAIKLLKTSLDKNGPFFEALHDLGLALAGNKCPQEGITALKKALDINAFSAEAHYNLAKIHEDLKAFPKALEHYKKALEINPNFIQALVSKGVVLHRLQQYPESLACYEKALTLDGGLIDAWVNMGFCLHKQKQFQEALAIYNHAIALDATSAESHWNKALTLLIQGDFINGFAEFEWRWKCRAFAHKIRRFSSPAWLGGVDIKDKTILLHNEQGLGDSIQFSRYVASVANLGAKVILEADPSLCALYSTLPGNFQLIKKGDPLPRFDYHSSLLSLPFALNTNLQNIPHSISYLAADPKKVKAWQLKLGDRKKIRVGITWSSVSTFENDQERSLGLSTFIEAFPNDKYDLICLQKVIKHEDVGALNARSDIRFFGDELKDFSDTAALIECVDLVISTCTSIPHLSCALGKPTWLLLSYVADWRWLTDREDSPWYQTARLYRQTNCGDWNAPLQRIAIDLDSLSP